MWQQRPDEPPKDPRPYESFSVGNVDVRLYGFGSDRNGKRPTAEISVPKPAEDKAGPTEAFRIDAGAILDIADRMRPLIGQGPKRPAEEAKDEPSPEFWPVVRVFTTLDSAAMVQVVKTFPSRSEAELHAFKHEMEAALTVPMKLNYEKGDLLVVAEEEMSHKLKQLTKEMKAYEDEYGVRDVFRTERPAEAPKTWSDGLVIPKLAASFRPGEPVLTRSFGGTRVDFFDKVDARGEKYSTVFVTKQVRQDDGTVKEVTKEYERNALLDRYRTMLSGRQSPRADRRLEVAAWRGPGKPRKGQEVAMIRGAEAIVDGPKKLPVATPTEPSVGHSGPRADGEPRYLAYEPTEKIGVYRVVGHAKSVELVESNIRRVESDRERQELKEDRAALARLANLVAKHEPTDAHQKEGLVRLIELLDNAVEGRLPTATPPRTQSDAEIRKPVEPKAVHNPAADMRPSEPKLEPDRKVEKPTVPVAPVPDHAAVPRGGNSQGTDVSKSPYRHVVVGVWRGVDPPREGAFVTYPLDQVGTERCPIVPYDGRSGSAKPGGEVYVVARILAERVPYDGKGVAAVLELVRSLDQLRPRATARDVEQERKHRLRNPHEASPQDRPIPPPRPMRF